MGNFKIDSSNLKLCRKFSAFIRCKNAGFYGLDFEKLLLFPLIKILGREFTLKQAAEFLKHSAEIMKV